MQISHFRTWAWLVVVIILFVILGFPQLGGLHRCRRRRRLVSMFKGAIKYFLNPKHRIAPVVWRILRWLEEITGEGPFLYCRTRTEPTNEPARWGASLTAHFGVLNLQWIPLGMPSGGVTL